MTFDEGFMAIQAAMEGLGVALGRFHLVEADIAAGRLVAAVIRGVPLCASCASCASCRAVLSRLPDVPQRR